METLPVMLPMTAELNRKIRTVLAVPALLPVDISTLGDGANLFRAGISSHASVQRVLALEDAFDVEFPDHMLKRSAFESVGAIVEAISVDRAGCRRLRSRISAPGPSRPPRRRLSCCGPAGWITPRCRRSAPTHTVDRSSHGGDRNFNNLKLAASEQAPGICMSVLELVGIAGYKNDSPYAVGRHLRDSLSARLMVANARIHEVDTGLLLIAKGV